MTAYMWTLTRGGHGRPGSWLARLLLATVMFVVAAEGMARIFWWVHYDLPFSDARHILFAFYPELRRVEVIHPSRHDGSYEILLLGESVLHRDWGGVEQALVEQLGREGHVNVRVSNAAVPAHTSRDSLLKYSAMLQARFDLVVVYDGINDTRTNNAPPAVFRRDYDHYGWYEVVNAMAPYHATAWFSLPYTLRYSEIGVRQRLSADRYVPLGSVRDDWRVYGRNARSVESLERNLTGILDIASRRGDRLVLMTLAAYMPPDYSFEAFQRHALDYDLHLSPIEIWGRPEYVMAAVASQNEAIRRLAAQNPNVLFVDQARLMPTGATYFNDVCHFTLVGSAKFVANLLDVLRPTLDNR